MNGGQELTVIIVSFNTRELTIRALQTLFADPMSDRYQVIVWDNASSDGSADAVEAAFGQVELIRSDENVGFARANNGAAKRARGEWIALLNSDTETPPGAMGQLVEFARRNPSAGIVGGRTVYADGSLNPTSCMRRMTVWGLFCSATGLSRLFRQSPLFNHELVGGWQRDSVRQIDVIAGCFLIMRTDLWERLGGFDDRFFMYGEDVDLCLRARSLGYRPMFTPDAEIVHFGGGSIVERQEKLVQLLRGRCTVIHRHWPPAARRFGLFLIWLWAALRTAGARIAAVWKGGAQLDTFRAVWRQRRTWLAGF